ncbi:Kynurenine formamidase [Zancudomyces culisetae]|uniref:Kynurenine formamidase n=1 Tax=Zancudomyces culisetae TaxID=1213189 RepID=A0A1R1PQI4_ZANCU|nr:Kynurenine formamidase [Zancudomyces culisetae]|eukprot:OMH83230.1 Kynurenine formamidase [Zancudomyces culisetae]
MSTIVHKDIPYIEGSTDKEQTLDLYIPQQAFDQERLPPLFVYIHGGCWRSSDKSEYVYLGTTMAKFGQQACATGTEKSATGGLVSICVINYRLTDRELPPSFKHPKHWLDCLSSIEFLVQNGTKYGYDSSRIYLCGHSAGGHLTGLTALDPPQAWWESLDADGSDLPISKRIRGVIGLCGIYDHTSLVDRYPDYLEFTEMTFGTDRTKWNATAPMHAPFSQADCEVMNSLYPPTFRPHGEMMHHLKYWIIRSTKDELLDHQQSQDYFKHLQELKMENIRLVEEDYGTHFGALENDTLLKLFCDFCQADS